MRPTENIEKLIKNTNIETNARTDDVVLDKVVRAFEESKEKDSPFAQPSIWRIIMKSRMTKLAAAAVIITTVFVGIHYFSGSLDGSTVALGEALDNMERSLWLHQVFNGTLEGKEVTSEQWISFESKIVALKQPDGCIKYFDYNKQKHYEYDPNSRTISMSYLKDKGVNVFSGLKSLRSFPDISIKKLVREGGKVAEKRGTYDGNTVRIYEITFSEHPTFKKTNIKFFIDPQSRLVIAEKVTVETENGDIIMEGEIKIDYPEKGPTSIYDIGVPSTVKIIGSEREKTEFEKAFDNAIAVIDNRKNWPEPRDLVVAYWEVRAAKNYDEMAILWPGSAIWNRQVLENEELEEYVFGKAQPAEIEGFMVVPYATKGYFENNRKYSLKMWLDNKKSTKGRFYIISGN
jgi:hypothetical protein